MVMVPSCCNYMLQVQRNIFYGKLVTNWGDKREVKCMLEKTKGWRCGPMGLAPTNLHYHFHNLHNKVINMKGIFFIAGFGFAFFWPYNFIKIKCKIFSMEPFSQEPIQQTSDYTAMFTGSSENSTIEFESKT